MRFSVLAVSWLLALTVGSAEEAPGEKTIEVYKSAPLHVDGVLDEPAWQAARKVFVRYIHGKERGKVDEAAQSYFMMCWDERYLYLAYEAVTATPVSGNTGTEEGPPGNRRRQASLRTKDGKPTFCFELIFGPNGDRHHLWEIKHNAANDFASKFWLLPRDKDDPVRKMIPYPGSPGVSLVNDYIDDAGPYRFASHARANYVKDGSAKRLTGYTAEVRLPIAGIRLDQSLRTSWGGPWDLSKGGRLIGLGAIQMPGDKASWRRSVGDMTGGWFHKQVDRFHTFVFANRAEAPRTPKEEK